ncbi:MAG: hypothetical protein U9Q21_04195 [Candidatus Auribacterota bacterium]|nr:hypothetical protein [Candidatus Auribacterota bacterium]
MKKNKKKDAAWMDRTVKHKALTHFFNFLIYSDNKTKCVGLRIKETGSNIMEGDPALKEILGPAFNNLQDACFYDLSKDIAGEWKPK